MKTSHIIHMAIEIIAPPHPKPFFFFVGPGTGLCIQFYFLFFLFKLSCTSMWSPESNWLHEHLSWMNGYTDCINIKWDEKFTGSGFFRGTTSPANILIFSARSGPSKHETIAETWDISTYNSVIKMRIRSENQYHNSPRKSDNDKAREEFLNIATTSTNWPQI